MKKTLSLLLALVMLVGMLPIQVFAIGAEGQHVHDYTTAVVASTCTEQGYTTYTCSCGETYRDNFVDATGNHTYENGFCTVCGNSSSLQGKTISILGDSISTYTGISNNTSYNATIGNNRIYYTAGKLGVFQKDTWWQQAIDQLGLKLLVNNSWSGSQVFGTGAEAQPAYIDRCVQLHNTQGESPDIIAVYLGTNDFTVSSGKLGTASSIRYDALITDNDGSFTYATPATVSEAYAIMLHKMSQCYPNAEIYCFTLLPRINQTAANIQLAEQFNDSITQIACKFGAHVVDLYNNSGIRADSNFKTFVADNALHPGPAGMDALTGCFTSAILENSRYYNGIAHNISYDLSNAIIAEGTAYAVEDSKTFSCSVTVPKGYEPVITVTMGGADITTSCVQGSKIIIDSVTGDVTITAHAGKPAPKDYRWEYNGSTLFSVDSTNVLNRVAGSISSSGIHSSGQYKLTNTINLFHDRPWVLEWKSTGEWTGRDGGSGVLLFAEGSASNTSNASFLYRRPGTDFIGLGHYSGAYKNYGVVLSGKGLDLSQEHTYRMENRISTDGSNMVWLLIDGVEMGPMIQYYEGGTNKNTTSTWVNGKDFKFSYMGTSAHPLGYCTINYIQVWENGHSHAHNYVAIETNPTCTEQGYTTYTCDCGDSYVDDYVNATGEHTYENGVCTGCGTTAPEQPAPEGEVISILGDSISTFSGFLPEGNAAYYPQNTVQNVADTWWMQLITELDAHLGVNESWSGSYVSETANNKLAMATLERIQNLDNNGTPDVILFFGGTNDIAFKRPMGNFDPASAPDEADLNATAWESLADGYTEAILRMQHYYPQARIISILPTINKTYYNNATLEQHNAVLRAICTHYGVEYVDLVAAGFTATMLGDATHPNAEGMDFITSAVKAVYTVETPNDCADGHQFGDWTECTSFTCQKRYMRECAVCEEKQYAKDISEQTIPFAVPAITANVGDLVNLSLYSVAFDAVSVIPAAELTWTADSVSLENNCVIPAAAGVYALTASAGENSKTVYLVVKNPEDAEYVLYYDDFDNAALEGYRAIEVPSGTEYYVSDGKLILDATGNSTNYMRILLPEWIGNFGDYEITTTFSMLSAMADTYWFATMARIQNEDFPYWQAAIRQNATTSNGVEITTRTKTSGASGGWTVTHKGAFSEKLSKSKYYQQTFALSGNKATHAINGSVLLSSESMTFVTGDVGFHLRACKVAVDSIKIVIPADNIAHSYSAWEAIREPDCTEKGEQIRTCSNCGVTETGEINALGHDLTSHAAKMPTCTDFGWMAYETCNRCSYSTLAKEIAPLDHVFDRTIHSVAHRGYSVDAPENTLVAYRMAKEKGFTYVECDVSFTADGIPVLLHDNTISRTSDGTGKISELTYEQLLTYDFGSWKDAKYAGTKIPTFEEFIVLCSQLGLHPYIELKANGEYSQKSVQTLVNIVEQYGMTANSTWISFEQTYLTYVKKASPTARLGYLYSYDASQTAINTAQNLVTGSNEVFLDLKYTSITEAGILRAASNGFAVEAWTVNDAQELMQLSEYISGITSDMLIAEAIVKNKTITLPTCTSQGYTTYTCSCGETYRDNFVDATKHSYENGVCVHCGTQEESAIVITKQPVSSGAILGGTASVSMEVSGYPLKYAWYFKDAGAKSFQKSSITASTYTLTMTEARANREVYCVVTDIFGNKVTSDTVKLPLLVNEELAIIKQPVPDAAAPGEKATISVEAKGDALKYAWYFKDAGANRFQKSTIQTANYTLMVKDSNASRVLYCVITDAHGNTVTTDTVNLLVVEPLEITKQPIPSGAILGGTASVSVEVSGYPLKYAWYFKDAGAKSFQKSSITASTYTLTMTEARANREVYCVVTDIFGNKVTSDTVKLPLLVNEELAIIKQPVAGYAEVNDKVTVSVEAKGDALKYQWYFKDSGAKAFQKSTIRESVYTIDVTKARNGREVYCVITDAHGNQITTETVVLYTDVPS